MTHTPIGGGADEMAVGRKNSGWKLKVWVVTWVMGGATNKEHYAINPRF